MARMGAWWRIHSANCAQECANQNPEAPVQVRTLSLVLFFLLKIWCFGIPILLEIAIELPWGGYGCFLEMFNAKNVFILTIIVIIFLGLRQVDFLLHSIQSLLF